jgi:hypothetical protein
VRCLALILDVCRHVRKVSVNISTPLRGQFAAECHRHQSISTVGPSTSNSPIGRFHEVSR